MVRHSMEVIGRKTDDEIQQLVSDSEEKSATECGTGHIGSETWIDILKAFNQWKVPLVLSYEGQIDVSYARVFFHFQTIYH